MINQQFSGSSLNANIPSNSKKEKRSNKFLSFVLFLFILICGLVGWHYFSTGTFPIVLSRFYDPLSNSEVSSLVTFLKQNNLQAAVVEKMYYPNDASVWLVKPDGQKIFIYSKSLGVTIGDFEGGPSEPIYKTAINEGSAAYEILLMPNRAQIYDHSQSKYYDISSYVNGYSISTTQGVDYIGVPNVPVNDIQDAFISGRLSPNGSYLFNYVISNGHNTGIFQLSKNNQGIAVPVKTSSNLQNFLAWSIDSKYVLVAHHSNYYLTDAIDLYNVQNDTVTPLDGVPVNIWMTNNTTDHTGREIVAPFIYPSGALFVNVHNPGGGTFFANLTDQNTNNVIKILPGEVKMVGLIP